MTNLELVELIADLAQEVEMEDPIDWGMLQIDEKEAYHLIASSVVERILSQGNDPITDREIGLLASTTKLAVENFALNLTVRGDHGR
jgi:hypothetical protein